MGVCPVRAPRVRRAAARQRTAWRAASGSGYQRGYRLPLLLGQHHVECRHRVGQMLRAARPDDGRAHANGTTGPVVIQRVAALQILVFLAVHRRGTTSNQLIAALWPGPRLTVELISRVPVHHRLLAGLRILATGGIAGIAAYVSYFHMAAVAFMRSCGGQRAG